VKITADQILRTGEARYPVIGASVDTGATTDTGAKILKVTSGGPAADAGLRKGDVVTDVAGEKVPDGIALIVAIRSHQPGDSVPFTVRRGASQMRLRITLGSEVG
jgi:putative serine protease PepD